MAEPVHVRADVLIIGAGLACCRATIGAAEGDAKKVLHPEQEPTAAGCGLGERRQPGMWMQMYRPGDLWLWQQ